MIVGGMVFRRHKYVIAIKMNECEFNKLGPLDPATTQPSGSGLETNMNATRPVRSGLNMKPTRPYGSGLSPNMDVKPGVLFSI